MATCTWCGEERRLEVFEWWREDRAWMLDCCCEGYYQGMLDEMNDPELLGDRTWRRGFATWWYEQTGQKVRRPYLARDGGIRLDYGLDLCDVTQAEAKAWVREHHRHNKPPAGWRWGLAVRNGPDLVAVAMVGRPVARRIDADRVVEVNRLCVDPNLDPALVWNACSMLYAEACREAARRGFDEVITYTLESEPGTGVKAAGFERVATTRGGSWSRPSRKRRDRAPTCPKARWSRLVGGTVTR
jgi:hypothetical protein